jgi:hypothetical protein
MSEAAREIDLYPPVKDFLERQGFEVKAEVGPADVMACRGDEPPVIVELKLVFSLSLFHQAVERLRVTDAVYIAVAHPADGKLRKTLGRNTALAKRLGLGVMTVRLRDGHVTVHCDPGDALPRRSARQRRLLLREFARRRGDPNAGGQTRVGLTTAYRQDALAIAAYLAGQGRAKGGDVAAATGVPRATRMMADNHYGWFYRVERGVYALSEKGLEAASGLAASVD